MNFVVIGSTPSGESGAADGRPLMPSNRRWMKFWPQDWNRDPALRSCGLSARGLWIEMICIAHDGTPYGHVTINGKAATMRQLASISGASEREVTRLLTELEEAGVFSKTLQGTIFSRRMERDHEASKAGRDNVEKRWANAREGNKPNQDIAKTPPIRGGNTLYSESESESDTESVSLRSTDRPRAKGTRLSDDWTPGPEGAAYARNLGLDPKAVFTVFRNYWQSKAGKEAVKMNWKQVWENWCLREAERSGVKPPIAPDLLTGRLGSSHVPLTSGGLS